MNIKRLSYKRAANLGDFESVHFDIEAEFGDEDTPAKVYNELKKFVDRAIAHEVAEHKKVNRNDKGSRN